MPKIKLKLPGPSFKGNMKVPPNPHEFEFKSQISFDGDVSMRNPIHEKGYTFAPDAPKRSFDPNSPSTLSPNPEKVHFPKEHPDPKVDSDMTGYYTQAKKSSRSPV